VVRMYVWQILQGLDYLHKAHVVHRDVKGQNVLISTEGAAKLSDFGSAGILDEIQGRKSVKGTPAWMAPEVISQQGHSWQCDIWSLGCTALEMLTADHPFRNVVGVIGGSHMALLSYIVDDERPIEYPYSVSEIMRALLDKCLQRDPSKRPTASRLLELDMFKDVGFWSDESDGDEPSSRRQNSSFSLQYSRGSCNRLSMVSSDRKTSGRQSTSRSWIEDEELGIGCSPAAHLSIRETDSLSASPSVSSGQDSNATVPHIPESRQSFADIRGAALPRRRSTLLTSVSASKVDLSLPSPPAGEVPTRQQSNPLSTLNLDAPNKVQSEANLEP